MAERIVSRQDGSQGQVELPASCSMPLLGNGNGDSSSPITVGGNGEGSANKINSIRIPLLQLNETQVPTSSGDAVAVSTTTAHLLAAWASLLANYSDVEYPYFGYTVGTTAGQDHFLCHACVTQSGNAGDVLSSITVDSWNQRPYVQGGLEPVYNTRFIDLGGDLIEQDWEKVH